MKRTLAFLAVTVIATSSSAFSVSRTRSHHLVKWYLDSSQEIVIHPDADGPTHLASGYSLDDVKAALQRAVDSWNAVDCTTQRLKLDTPVPNTTPNVVFATTSEDLNSKRDHQNIATWVSDPTKYSFGARVLGVTAPVFFQDGTIVEADVAFNDVAVTWAVYRQLSDVPGGSLEASGTQDIESVAVHEFGHLLGLAHVIDPDRAQLADPPTMEPMVDNYLGTQSLAVDDKNGVCFLYPADGNTSHDCDSDANCPQFIDSTVGVNDSGGIEVVDSDKPVCSGGHCTLIEDVQCGSGNAGERCCDGTCNGSLYCVSVDTITVTVMAYCGALCTNSACADGFTCKPLSEGSNKVCITDVVNGCDCDTSDACQSNCACDNDCSDGGSINGGSGSATGGGCAGYEGSSWSVLLCSVVAFIGVRRRRKSRQTRLASP